MLHADPTTRHSVPERVPLDVPPLAFLDREELPVSMDNFVILHSACSSRRVGGSGGVCLATIPVPTQRSADDEASPGR